MWCVHRQVLGLHEGKAWRIVQEHLHDTIGKQLVGLDAVQAALPHFLAEVDCPFNSKEWQLYYLDQYVEHVALLQRQQVWALRWVTSCWCVAKYLVKAR